MAKKNDMTKKTDQELLKELAELRAQLRTHRFEAAGARPKDSNILKKTRVSIARILTEQRARTLRAA